MIDLVSDIVQGVLRVIFLITMTAVLLPGIVVTFFVHGIIEGCLIGWAVWREVSDWAMYGSKGRP